MATVAYTDLPAGIPITMIQNSDGTWPNRLSSRTDLPGIWIRIVANTSDPTPVTSPDVTGAYNNDITVGA